MARRRLYARWRWLPRPSDYRKPSSCSSFPPTPKSTTAVGDISLLPVPSRRAPQRRRRAARAAVSVDPGRSISRVSTAPESGVGARARAARAGDRNRARDRCLGGRDSCRSCPSPASILLSSCEIKPGIDIDPHQLANTLALGGYEPADPVDAHGEFARRGGIFDVFPAGEELPIRIEFIGDTVESIRRFDPGTQRSVETLDRFGIVPVRESTTACLRVWHRYPRICFSFCVPRMRRCGCPSQPMWKNTSSDAWQHISRVVRRRAWNARKGDRALRSRPRLLVTEDEIAAELANAIVVEELGARATRSLATGSAWSQFQCNRRPRSMAAFPTGSTTSRPRRPMAITSCSSPARTAAPSARSSCCRTTTSAPSWPRTPATSSAAPCSSPKAGSRRASGLRRRLRRHCSGLRGDRRLRRRAAQDRHAARSDRRPPRSSPTFATSRSTI